MGTAPEQKTESAKDGKDSMSLPSFQSLRVQQVAPTVSPPGSVVASALKWEVSTGDQHPLQGRQNGLFSIIWRGLAALSKSVQSLCLIRYLLITS